MIGDTSSYSGLRRTASRDDTPAAITDVGCERDINEDRYAVIDCPVGRLWVVCDGMGGVQGGELAAQLAIDAMRRGIESRPIETPEDALLTAIEEANRVIVLRRHNPQFSGMGTTVVAAMMSGGRVVIGSAGDSRAYLIRDGQIQQLTTDHTYVQDLVDRGMIRVDEAMTHPQAHVLTRCLGAEPRLQIDRHNFWVWDTESGESHDRLLLCSDGLYSHVSDNELAEIVSHNSPQEACVQLVELAKRGGGYDNITLAVLPMPGQLRDEAPGRPPRAGGGFHGPKVDEPDVERISWPRQLMILALLAVIGAVCTTLLVFWQMAQAGD